MQKYIDRLNTYLYEMSIKLKDFFMKNIYIVIISIFVGILINIVDIFTFKFGLDSTIMPYSVHFKLQRYGSLLLYDIFPFLTNNFISQIIGIISLVFASLLMISRYNISNAAKTIFIILFISSIYLSRLQYFFFQSSYNFIGLFLVVAAFRLIENNKNIFIYIISIFFIFIGISSYQSNFAIYLSVMMLNVVLSFINNKNIKASIILIIKSIIILLLSLLVYYLSIKIISTNISSHFTNMITWTRNNADYINILSNLFNFIIYKNIWFYLYFFVVLLFIIFNFDNLKQRVFFSLLSILLFLAIYSLNILIGNIMPERARTPMALLPAFTFILYFIYKNNNIFKTIVISLSFIPIIINTNNIIKYHVSNVIMYEQDKITTSKVIDIIYTKYPEIFKSKYKIAFYGKVKPNKHLLKTPIPYSFWNDRNPSKMYAFLQLFGFPDTIEFNFIGRYGELNKLPEDIQTIIKKMPSYPSPDCAKLYKDTIYVKLSD